VDRRRGFTLLEMLIVVTVIAIVASIAIPNLLSGKAAANENATIGSMRTIVSAMLQFKSRGILDLDGDGRYEYPTFAELSGSVAVRGTAKTLDPPMLPGSFGFVDPQGRVTRKGYLYALYLPDGGGVGLPETAGSLPSVDPNNAALAWSVLAWPVEHGRTGNSTFFTNEQGEVVKAAKAQYSGETSVPPAGAALVGGSPNNIMGGQIANGIVGADGNRWTPVK
jgi:prepilin-type N-terminal cleavage/methylation domain-containing protein